MKTRNSKLLLSLVLTLAMLVTVMTVFAVSASASEMPAEPTLTLYGRTLSLENNINIRYYMTIENADAAQVEMLFWDQWGSDTYTKGTELYSTKTAGYKEEYGAYAFDYTEITAKQMSENVYARAYINVDGTDYYGDVIKYSVLEYAYNTLKKETTSDDLKALLTATLEYGAAAQTFFGDTSRLANATYYKVTVVGGTLTDGFTSGLFAEGNYIGLNAPVYNAEGQVFSHWEDSEGNMVSHTLDPDGKLVPCDIYAPAKDETYTPVYVAPAEPQVKGEVVATLPATVTADTAAMWASYEWDIQAYLTYTPTVAGTYTIYVPEHCGLKLNDRYGLFADAIEPGTNFYGTTISFNVEADQPIFFYFTCPVAGTYDYVISYEAPKFDPSTLGESAGSFEITTTDSYSFVDNYTFTASAAGDYSFYLPAGTGALDPAGLNDFSIWPYVDFNENPNGAYFTLTLAADESITIGFGALENGYTFTVEVYFKAAPYATMDVTVTDNNTYEVDKVTYTAPEAGKYTFVLPEGLGATDVDYAEWVSWDPIFMVDYATGGSFTVTLEAGQEFAFYIASAEKATFTIDIFWAEAPAAAFEAVHDDTELHGWYDSEFTSPVTGTFTVIVPEGIMVEFYVGGGWGTGELLGAIAEENGGSFVVTITEGDLVVLSCQTSVAGTYVIELYAVTAE